LTVPRDFHADGTPGRLLKLSWLTPTNEVAPRHIEEFHAGRRKSVLLRPQDVEGSCARALRGLDEAVAALCARPEVIAYQAARERSVTATPLSMTLASTCSHIGRETPQTPPLALRLCSRTKAAGVSLMRAPAATKTPS
jgi:hypothetical protein